MSRKVVMILLFTLLILGYKVSAQYIDPALARKGSLIVTFNPLPIIIKQYTLNIEFIHKENRSIALESGFAKALKDSYTMFPIYLHNSIIVRASNFNFYRQSKKMHWFHGPGVLYRRQWNNNASFSDISCSGSNYYQRRKGHTAGVQYSFGMRAFFKMVVLSPFVRAGLVMKYINIKTYGGGPACTTLIFYPMNDYRTSIYPTLELETGVRMGFRIKKEDKENLLPN